MPNFEERVNECALVSEGAVRLANSVTGADDSNIADAVKTLIDGYWQGGGDSLTEYIGDAVGQNVINASYGELMLPESIYPTSALRRFVLLPTVLSNTTNRNPLFVFLYFGKIANTDRVLGSALIYTGGSGTANPTVSDDGRYYINGTSNIRFLNASVYRCYEIK